MSAMIEKGEWRRHSPASSGPAGILQQRARARSTSPPSAAFSRPPPAFGPCAVESALIHYA
jgi:hypothetical protein